MSQEYYSRLKALETPRKSLSDEGTGLVAAGVGLLGAAAVWRLYHRFAWMRRLRSLLALWLGLWLVRIPFSFYFYGSRAIRGDYPPWADSIAIPIMSESIAWVICAIITVVILRVLIIHRELPDAIRVTRPVSIRGWSRAIFICAWLGLNCYSVKDGILDGDIGFVFSPIVASVILLAFMAAPRISDPQATGDSLGLISAPPCPGPL